MEKLSETNKRERLKVKEAPVILTDHIMDRFKARYTPLDEFDWVPETNEEWREKIESLFRDSTEVTLSSISKVKRLINSEFQDARYFYNKAHYLRFVAIEEDGAFILKTVEIPKDFKRKNGDFEDVDLESLDS